MSGNNNLMKNKAELYRIKTSGVGTHYVIAESPGSAIDYLQLRLNSHGWGLPKDRYIVMIEVLAQENDRNAVNDKLWICRSKI